MPRKKIDENAFVGGALGEGIQQLYFDAAEVNAQDVDRLDAMVSCHFLGKAFHSKILSHLTIFGEIDDA